VLKIQKEVLDELTFLAMENLKVVKRLVDFGGSGSIDWKYSTAKPNKPSKNAESLLQLN
jgi:hypothetical protein